MEGAGAGMGVRHQPIWGVCFLEVREVACSKIPGHRRPKLPVIATSVMLYPRREVEGA